MPLLHRGRDATDVASRQCHTCWTARCAVGSVKLDSEFPSERRRNAAGHAVAHGDGGAVGLGEPVVAVEDDFVADCERDRAVVVGRAVGP